MPLRSYAGVLLVGAALLLTACDQTLLDDATYATGPVGSAISASGSDLPILHVDDQGNAYVPGQLVVRFRPGAARAEIAQANRASLQRQSRLDRMWILDVPVGEEEAIRESLSRNPNVEFAEIDYAVQLIPCGTGDCTDPQQFFSGRKWDLHNTGSIIDNSSSNTVVATTGKAGADIDWLEAYDYLGQGFDGSAAIAIIDTGIRPTHGDLAGKVIAARNFAVGYPADLVGDRIGHGTHVAGIAAASGQLAMHGVAWGSNIKLIDAKACELYLFPGDIVDSSCPNSSVADAIMWAVDQGANVINLSLGGAWTATAGVAPQQAALQYARTQNVLPFCSSGNSATAAGYVGTATRGVSFPARFPECVAVGSTDWFDGRSSFSSWGPQVELSAPGGQVFAGGGNPFGAIFSLSHQADNQYTYMQGTSMAAPQAAGLAALLFAYGVTDANEVLRRMKETADDLGTPGRNPEFGYGRINVYRALTGQSAAIPFTISTRSTVSLSARGNMQVTLLGKEAVSYGLDMLDLGTITLGPVPVASRPNGTLFTTWSDVDGDGLDDLVLHFSIPQLVNSGALTSTTTELTLRASLSDGRSIRGTASVNVNGSAASR